MSVFQEQIIEVEEDLSEEEELLLTEEGGPRVFVLESAMLQTMMGILLDESDDSFLVALPARLVDIDGKKVAVSFIDAPYIRLQKSSVTMTCYLMEPFGEEYRKYIETEGIKIYPDAAEWLPYWKDGYDVVVDAEPEQSAGQDESTVVDSTSKTEPVKTGMTDEEVTKYLSSKL